MSIIKDIGASIFGGETSGEAAARTAGEVQATAAREALEEQRRQFGITQEQAEPFRQAELEALQRGAPLRAERGETALEAFRQQRALTGLAGAEAQQQAMAGLEASPAQQFIRERQQQSLLRSSAALGGLGGGQVRSELQQQAAGFASQDLQNQLARLSSLSGTGQVAPQVAQQLGMQRGQFAGQAGGLMQAAGQAQAGGILGAQQARAGLQGQLLGAGIGAGLGGAGLLGSGVGAGRGALLGLI